jgi:membrane protein
MNLSQLPAVLKETFSEWSNDNCLRLGAALSYYTLSSLIPLILIVVSVVTFFLNFTGQGQNVQQQLVDQITGAVNNPALAEQITEALTGRSEDAASQGIIGAITGFFLLLLAASGVFGELDSAFNIIWDVPQDQQAKGVMGFIKTKFLSFTLVLGVAFLLIVSQVLTVVLTSLADRLPLGVLWTIINFAVQIGVIALVFAVLFKYLPDTEVEWRDVLLGGLLTAILWIVGQQLLSLYFRYGTSFSSYGALGGVLAFLLYVYYSSQILFLGGEFTQVYARRHGSKQPAQTEEGEAAPSITPDAAIMVATASTMGKQQQEAQVAALKTRQYAAAATGGIIGLVGGAAIGGVGLIWGLARGAAKLRRR